MENAMQSITLYNFYMDPETGYDMVKRTFIPGVSVVLETKVTVDKDGLATGDVTKIRIPVESIKETYLRPTAFQAAENKDGVFTLAADDMIVIGCAEEESPRPSELEARYGNEFAVKIVGVTDNRGKRGAHWKVICQ